MGVTAALTRVYHFRGYICRRERDDAGTRLWFASEEGALNNPVAAAPTLDELTTQLGRRGYDVEIRAIDAETWL